MAKIGFIGAGNMAEALIRGIIAAGQFVPADVLVSDIRPERFELLTDQYGVTAVSANSDITAAADVVVLSVKPQVMADVLKGVKGTFKKDAVVISIAAGITTAGILDVIGEMTIIRVMPNTPALVGEGMSALFSPNADEQAMQAAVELFSAVGKAVVVDSEDLIDAVTAVSGSGPAYYFLMMEEMIKAGEKLGLSPDTATQLVLQTAKGASLLAEIAKENGETVEELRRKVTSPGGTTEAAINVFKNEEFGLLVCKALTAARDRGRELSG